jgi:hypothetical protein
VVWPSLPALLPMLGVAAALDQWLMTDSLGLLCFKVVACGLVYLTGFFYSGLSRTERALLLGKLLRGAPAARLETE